MAETVSARRIRVTAALVLAAVVLGAGLVFLHENDPMQASYLPPCLLNKFTGLYCPGCGATRATHALLHGDIVAALSFNLLFVLSIPLLIWIGYRELGAMISGKPVPPSPSKHFTRGYVVFVIVFTVLRNIPVEPFSWLAP